MLTIFIPFAAFTYVARWSVITPPASRVPAATPRSQPMATPEALRAWCIDTSRRLRSGDSLVEVLNTNPPTELPSGVRVADRLERASARAPSSDLRLLLDVLRVLVIAGGSSVAALDLLADRLQLDIEERRERRVQSSAARISAAVLSWLPPSVLLMIAATSRDTRTFLTTPLGVAILFVGGALNLAGNRLIARAISRPLPQEQLLRADVTEFFAIVALYLSSGLSFRSSLEEATLTAPSSILASSAELRTQLQNGALIADALAGFAATLDDETQHRLSALVTAYRSGSPITTCIDEFIRISDDERHEQGLTYAKGLMVRLAGPLVLFILPSFITLALLPPVASSLVGVAGEPFTTN